MISNQLKLNLNSVVDGLNLVNVVQKPQPITIHNLSNTRNFSPPTRDPNSSHFHNPSDFEVIDEDKMRMYSYLVRREMKTNEWLSRFHLTHPDSSQFGNLENSKKIGDLNKPVDRKRSIASKSKTTTTQVKSNKSPSRVNRVISHAKPANELEELKNCCDETVKSIEYLENKLSECNFN